MVVEGPQGPAPRGDDHENHGVRDGDCNGDCNGDRNSDRSSGRRGTSNDGENGMDERSIHIGNTGGNVTIGNNNRVSHQVVTNGAQPGAEQLELLTAVRELRADLARFSSSEAITVLEGELVGAEADITESGEAGPERRSRIGHALDALGALAGSLNSAEAVTRALQSFAGG